MYTASHLSGKKKKERKKQDLEDWLSERAAAILRPFSSLCETNTDFVKVAPSHKINLFILLVEVHWVYRIDNQSEEDLRFFFWSSRAVIRSVSFHSSCT